MATIKVVTAPQLDPAEPEVDSGLVTSATSPMDADGRVQVQGPAGRSLVGADRRAPRDPLRGAGGFTNEETKGCGALSSRT
jgi:hypothetical protein